MQNYKGTINQIIALPWKSLKTTQLLQLMVLAYFSAQEFAESLRIACQLHSDDADLKSMAAGELQTNNLRWEEYSAIGDHADFLRYFLNKYNIWREDDESFLNICCSDYLLAIRSMPDETRSMSIFSREHELPDVFKAVCESNLLDTHPALKAFRYYMQRHISLDSEQGGHADLVSLHRITEDVGDFWKARLLLYRPLFPNLCELDVNVKS